VTVLVLVTVDGAAVVVDGPPLCVRCVGPADVLGAAEALTGVVAGGVVGAVEGDGLVVSFTTA